MAKLPRKTKTRSAHMHNRPTRPSTFDLALSLRLALFTVGSLVGLLIWDFSGLDLTVMHWLANDQGFALRNNWWLGEILHTRSRQLAFAVFLALTAMIWWPAGLFRKLSRWQRIEVPVGIGLCLVTISTLKHFSLTSCPWDLQDFGGKAWYVSHWRWGLSDGGAGHCFPGGHVASAFAFIALSLPWLLSSHATMRRRGRLMLYVVLLLGLVFGLTQTVRGAHYPSHTLWTGWICWLLALANHLVFGWLTQKRECLDPPRQASPSPSPGRDSQGR